MSLRISKQYTRASASPSVSLEKGAYYRTQASRTSPASATNIPNPYTQRRVSPQNQENTRLLGILLLLVFACITCFGTAYYLFKTSQRVHLQ